MQSVLFFPIASAGGLLRPAPLNVSDQATLKAPISANQRHAASSQALSQSAKFPDSASWQQLDACSSSIPSQPPSAARPQLSLAQQSIRPVRPLRTPNSIQWSPTRELLSEPHRSLQEVVKTGTKLASSQQVTSQQLLGTVRRALGPSQKPPSNTSRQFTAALQAAAAVAAQQQQPQTVQHQEQPSLDLQPGVMEQQQQQQQQQRHPQHSQQQQQQQQPFQQQQQQLLQTQPHEAAVFHEHAACLTQQIAQQGMDKQQQQQLLLEHLGEQQQQEDIQQLAGHSTSEQQQQWQPQTTMMQTVTCTTAHQQWQVQSQLHLQWQGRPHGALATQQVSVRH